MEGAQRHLVASSKMTGYEQMHHLVSVLSVEVVTVNDAALRSTSMNWEAGCVLDVHSTNRTHEVSEGIVAEMA